MIAALLLLCLVGVVTPQRSPYLSSAEYPGLLPRFRPSTPQPSANDSELEHRFGAGQTSTVSPYAEGTLYDSETINRVAQWPKEKQPFWYVNRQHIAGHRGTAQNGTK